MNPHPPMPQIPLSRQQIDDIIAYLGAVQTAAAATQGVGNAAAGLAYAEQVCAECHAVRGGQFASRLRRAPAFQSIADARGMSELALRVWFQSAHPTMPNLVIQGQVADDLAAYILSLKRRG